MPADLRTGTMGWSYEDWRGTFYPSDLPTAKWLGEYAKIFSTVELDSTFYGVPRPTTLDNWTSLVPAGFLFSAKVPRAVTHERRLVGATEAALDFGTLLRERLGEKLGGLLLQLPPDFSTDERENFDVFIAGLTSSRLERGLPWVVEFRHPSWTESGIADSLGQFGITCATTERLDTGGPLRYVRLLGTENSVARFDERQFVRTNDLAAWSVRLDEARNNADNQPILVYVRNFYEGHAPGTILALREMLGLSVPVPPGKQQMSLF